MLTRSWVGCVVVVAHGERFLGFLCVLCFRFCMGCGQLV